MTARDPQAFESELVSTLRAIIEGTQALVFAVDRQYRYTSFNEAHRAVMKALYGAEIEPGGSLLDYMTVEADRATARHNLDQALAGRSLVEEAFSGEELRSRQYFRVAHCPIRKEGGEVIGVAVIAEDLSERKRAEDALRDALAANERLVAELREALANVRTLGGLLPFCAWCKKIRDDSGYWKQIETYIAEHSDARLSHGICPECLARAARGE